ncbi:MAG: aldo/keto reductase [Spirochaetaceae bacterium]|nr:aldo/keto reductase [Spirochaetaceae bacterium]
MENNMGNNIENNMETNIEDNIDNNIKANMNNDKPCGMNRRGFIKLVGAGAVAGTALATLGSCGKTRAPQARVIPTDKMTYRVDPKSGNNLSLLGFGMMRLPRVVRRRGESLPNVNDLDQEAVNELVDYAIAHGVNVFDTAPPYCKGFSEKATGEALSRHPRNKYFIATKMSNRGASASRAGSLRMYHKSFEDLKVDYIDYYFLHSPTSHRNFRERYIDNGILDFLVKEKEAGRIRNLGWSFHGDGNFFEYMSSGKYPWDFTMIALSYLDWWHMGARWAGSTNMEAQRKYDILVQNNIPIWIMSPVLGGGLAMPHFRAREQMAQEDPNVSSASWAFRFAGNLPNVVTVLSGMTFMDHLKDNIYTHSPLAPLSDSEKRMLEEISQIMLEKRTINCTKCQYCMPCPYGIDIPEILIHYNRSLNEGNYPEDRQCPDFRRARRAFLVGMDRRISPLRQANRCINCKLCIPTCPQRINIPQELRRIAKFVESLRVEG